MNAWAHMHQLPTAAIREGKIPTQFSTSYRTPPYMITPYSLHAIPYTRHSTPTSTTQPPAGSCPLQALVQAIAGAIPAQAAHGGRKLAVDPFLRVIGASDVVALGDCSLTADRLPPTAQVRRQLQRCLVLFPHLDQSAVI